MIPWAQVEEERSCSLRVLMLTSIQLVVMCLSRADRPLTDDYFVRCAEQVVESGGAAGSSGAELYNNGMFLAVETHDLPYNEDC